MGRNSPNHSPNGTSPPSILPPLTHHSETYLFQKKHAIYWLMMKLFVIDYPNDKSEAEKRFVAALNQFISLGTLTREQFLPNEKKISQEIDFSYSDIEKGNAFRT